MLLAGGWGVAVSDAMLNNILLRKLPEYVPGIDPRIVLSLGAAGIKDAYHGDELRGVRLAYLDGLHGGWAFGAAAFGVALLCAAVPKWPGRLLAAGGDAFGTEDIEDAIAGKSPSD